jgi:6-phosphogluconolactonase
VKVAGRVADVRLVVSGEPVRAAAAAVVAAVRAADRRTGPRLAVPGGSAAKAIRPVRDALSAAGIWHRVRLTWVDERCVPFDSEDSNRGAAYRAGFLDAGAPPGTEVALFADEESPDDAVVRVRSRLASAFDGALDVALLGMGEDGHIASLFVGRGDAEGPVAHVPDSPKPPPSRITLTRAFLRTASRSVLLATGEQKRAALTRLVRGDDTLPASGLPELTIVTDLEMQT